MFNFNVSGIDVGHLHKPSLKKDEFVHRLPSLKLLVTFFEVRILHPALVSVLTTRLPMIQSFPFSVHDLVLL